MIITNARDLSQLFDLLTAPDFDADAVDMTSLPTFGGPDVEDTTAHGGVWSWDEREAIVSGDDGRGYQVVDRNRCDMCAAEIIGEHYTPHPGDDVDGFVTFCAGCCDMLENDAAGALLRLTRADIARLWHLRQADEAAAVVSTNLRRAVDDTDGRRPYGRVPVVAPGHGIAATLISAAEQRNADNRERARDAAAERKRRRAECRLSEDAEDRAVRRQESRGSD